MSAETRFLRPASARAGSLSDDLTDVVLKRVVFLCLTPPALVILGNLLNLLNSYVLQNTSFDYTLLEGLHDLAITLVSLAVAWFVHGRRASRRTLVRLGLSYCVFVAVWFSVAESLVVMSYHSEPVRLGLSYFTFSLVWVVFFPAIVPMRTPTAIVTILLAATGSLLVRWIAHGLGWVQFSGASLSFVTITMVFSVLLGVAVSDVVYKLGRSVTEARKMGSYVLERSLGVAEWERFGWPVTGCSLVRLP